MFYFRSLFFDWGVLPSTVTNGSILIQNSLPNLAVAKNKFREIVSIPPLWWGHLLLADPNLFRSICGFLFLDGVSPALCIPTAFGGFEARVSLE